MCACCVVQLKTSLGQTLSLHEASTAGCLISGVLLQGALWDRSDGTLAETGTRSIYSAMPLLWLVPVLETSGHTSVVTAEPTSRGQALGSLRAQSPNTASHGGPTTRTHNLGGMQRAQTPTSPHRGAGSQVPSGSLGTLAASRTVHVSRGVGGTSQREGASVWEGLQEESQEVEMYVCPVYMYSHKWENRTSNVADVEDCLFDVLLPPGRHAPQHWVTRNVVLMVCSDPGSLTAGAQ